MPVPAGFDPISIADAQKSINGGDKPPSSLSRFGSGVYSQTVAPLVKLFTTNPIDTVTSMFKTAMAPDEVEAIAKAAKSGDYKSAAVLAAHYLSEGPATRMADAGIVQPVKESIKQGDYAGAAGELAGSAASLAVPALGDTEIAAGAGKIAQAADAGIRAGAPDVAAGLAKTAAGEVLAKVPGLEWPARIALQYPALRQVSTGAKAGAEAFSEALKQRVAGAAGVAAADAEDPILNGLASLRAKGGKFADLSADEQAQVRDLADRFRDTGSSAKEPPKPAPKLLTAAPIVTPAPPGTPGTGPSGIVPYPEEMLPEPIRGKQAAPASEVPKTEQTAKPDPTKDPRDLIAQQGVFGKKYNSFAQAPASAQKTIQAVVDSMGVKPAETVPRETSTPAVETAQPAGQTINEMFRALPDEAARAEFLRQREAADTPAKAVAKGMYAQGKQTPEQAAETFSEAGSSDKAQKVAQAVHDQGVTHDFLTANFTAKEIADHLEPLRKQLQANQPNSTPMSPRTVGNMLFHLKRMEDAASKTQSLFHGTTSDALEDIQQNGILYRRAGQAGKGRGTVGKTYVSPFPEIASDEAMNTVYGDDATETAGRGGEPTLIEIDRSKLKGLQKDKEYSQGRPFDVGSLTYKEDIPPDAIRAVHRGTEAIKAVIEKQKTKTLNLAKKSGRE